MCFGSSTIDDPTQPPIRKVNPWDRKVLDPTQQPFHISESNEAHEGDLHAQDTRQSDRKGSNKNRAAFVDVTDQEMKPVAKRRSMVEAEPARPTSEKTASANKSWRGRSSNPATFGLGYGADFAATPM